MIERDLYEEFLRSRMELIIVETINIMNVFLKDYEELTPKFPKAKTMKELDTVYYIHQDTLKLFHDFMKDALNNVYKLMEVITDGYDNYPDLSEKISEELLTELRRLRDELKLAYNRQVNILNKRYTSNKRSIQIKRYTQNLF